MLIVYLQWISRGEEALGCNNFSVAFQAWVAKRLIFLSSEIISMKMDNQRNVKGKILKETMNLFLFCNSFWENNIFPFFKISFLFLP